MSMGLFIPLEQDVRISKSVAIVELSNTRLGCITLYRNQAGFFITRLPKNETNLRKKFPKKIFFLGEVAV